MEINQTCNITTTKTVATTTITIIIIIYLNGDFYIGEVKIGILTLPAVVAAVVAAAAAAVVMLLLHAVGGSAHNIYSLCIVTGA